MSRRGLDVEKERAKGGGINYENTSLQLKSAFVIKMCQAI